MVLLKVYACATDEVKGLVVWRPSGCTPEEWSVHIEDVRKVIGWSKRLGFRPCILLLADGFERPDPKTRMRLAEVTGHADYDPYIAFVNSSAMLRGLLTVFSWMHGKPQYEMTYVANEGTGIAWLEQRRGKPLPEFKRLLYETRVQLYAAEAE